MLNVSRLYSNKFNVRQIVIAIDGNCGSGKTTAAINKIGALASSPRKALFLIDT